MKIAVSRSGRIRLPDGGIFEDVGQRKICGYMTIHWRRAERIKKNGIKDRGPERQPSCEGKCFCRCERDRPLRLRAHLRSRAIPRRTPVRRSRN